MEHKDERGLEAREIRGDELAEIQEALAGAPPIILTDEDIDAMAVHYALHGFKPCQKKGCVLCDFN